jgi:hypothetical protein
MDPNVVLAKTPLGAEALNGQGAELPRALRHALILVDGRSTVAKLEQRASMIPEFPAALRELAAKGLVAPVGGGSGSAGSQAGSPPGAGRSLSASLIAAAEAILGDKAGKVVKKLEEAGGSRETLAAAVDSCYKLIRLTIDESRAEEFRKAAKDIIGRG